jgi:hypothetical protein
MAAMREAQPEIVAYPQAAFASAAKFAILAKSRELRTLALANQFSMPPLMGRFDVSAV